MLICERLGRFPLKKGNLSVLGHLWACLALHFQIDKTYLAYFKKRLDSEGINFLTKELPSLGKDLDRSLIVGEPLIISGRFGKHSDTNLPDFLYEIFIKIFNKDGTLRKNASPHHIKVGRQLTLMFYKLEVQYEEDTLKKSIDSFVSRDIALSTPISELGCQDKTLDRARAQLHRILPAREGFTNQLVPRHGSGATACRTRPQDKYHRTPRFIEKLNNVFDYGELFFLSTTHVCDELKKLTHSANLDRPVARLSAVPKDSRGPRLICMEPREMMYVQQGLMRMIYQIVENHPVTQGFVNFTNQSVNKDLAKLASEFQCYATLDLKDASDRVRWDLVKILFPFEWVRAFDACRTEYVELPDGTEFGPLAKFAPMGSALCFPVEALVFWAILKGNLHTDVYVYGDDIIVPMAHVDRAIELLESIDLKVNVEKSCYRTPFRESCGGDYYDGHDVGYVKCRKPVQKNVRSHESFIGFTNEIIEAYGIEAGRRLMSFGDGFYYPHPRTLSGLPLTYRDNNSAVNSVFFKKRWRRCYQRMELLIPQVQNRIKKYRSNPKFHWCELLRKFLTSDTEFRVGEYADGTCTVKDAWRAYL